MCAASVTEQTRDAIFIEPHGRERLAGVDLRLVLGIAHALFRQVDPGLHEYAFDHGRPGEPPSDRPSIYVCERCGHRWPIPAEETVSIP